MGDCMNSSYAFKKFLFLLCHLSHQPIRYFLVIHTYICTYIHTYTTEASLHVTHILSHSIVDKASLELVPLKQICSQMFTYPQCFPDTQSVAVEVLLCEGIWCIF